MLVFNHGSENTPLQFTVTLESKEEEKAWACLVDQAYIGDALKEVFGVDVLDPIRHETKLKPNYDLLDKFTEALETNVKVKDV